MGNTSASLEAINQAAWDGTDLRQLHRQTQELLRAVMHLQWNAGQSLDLPDHVIKLLGELVGKLPPWRIVKALKTWGEVNMRYDAPSTLPLELAAVEICTAEAAPAADAAPPAAARAPERPASARPQPAPRAAPRSPIGQPTAPAGAPGAAPARQPVATPATAAPRPATPERVPAAAPAAREGGLAGAWAATVRALSRQRGKKYFLGALLRDCRPESVYLEGDILCLPFSHRTHMERMQEEMDDPTGRRMLSDVIGQCFDKGYEFKITLTEDNGNGGSAQTPAQNSPLVRTAMGMGARILKEVTE